MYSILTGPTGQQIKVIGTGGQVIKTQASNLPGAQNQGMSGIAALAAAAAATSKITTSVAQTISTSGAQGIKVIQQGQHGQLITPQGVKVTPVGTTGISNISNTQTAIIGGQQVRLASPSGGTLLKTAGGLSSPGGKQIILQKQQVGIGATGQPQIVTLVKTASGMQVWKSFEAVRESTSRITAHPILLITKHTILSILEQRIYKYIAIFSNRFTNLSRVKYDVTIRLLSSKPFILLAQYYLIVVGNG